MRLDEELRFLDDYLAVEQIRFSDRLRIVRAVETGLLDALVPQFILQPLVENALRHGIGPSVTGGTIEIGARLDGDDLVLSVSDDGPGIGEEPNAAGVGLRNTRERIMTLYGARGYRVSPRPGAARWRSYVFHIGARLTRHETNHHTDRRRRAAGATRDPAAPRIEHAVRGGG